MDYKSTLDYAKSLDDNDALASFRYRFYFPQPDLIYMDGNSLGRLPLETVERSQELIKDEWGEQLVRSWGSGWIDATQRIGEKIADLIGAAHGQVVIADSTSVNLYKLSMSALAIKPGRTKIISDVSNFPSDLYVLQSCQHSLGNQYHIELLPEGDGIQVDLRALLDAIDTETALVLLSHVLFKSGYLYDARTITDRCHQVGALVLWDLSHSVGVVPIQLDEWDVDFATGCTYKYLNGGPGAPAFLYVNQGLQDTALSPIWGWFGQDSPFSFETNYVPAQGIKQFLTGTPPILSVSMIEPGVDLIREAGIEAIRQKSLDLTSYFIYLFDEVLKPLSFTLGTTRNPSQRGSHISLRHPQGYRITRALIEEMRVIPDFREPDRIRFGLAPLYTSYADVWEAVERTRRAVVEKRFMKYPANRQKVT